MTKTLQVWWDGRKVGRLSLNAHGEPGFAYDPDWLGDDDSRPVSLSLPLQTEPFNRRQTLPFFEGLLPEEGQRRAVAQALGVSSTNEFRLLEELGGDVAGALEILPDGQAPRPQSEASDTPPPLDDADLGRILDTLPRRPMLAGEGRGLRLSLAGAQSKLPVVLTDGRIGLPNPGQPTTHILKPGIARFDGTTENEAFCLTLAAQVGLDVAPVEIRSTGDHRYLLIDRYDREHQDGFTRRLHQEDMCQALGFTSARKYASDGGPVLRDCFGLLRAHAARPAPNVLALLDAVIFNVIIGNADAHAKNFSLLHTSSGLRLAPLYDLLSTAAYPEISDRFAMKVGQARTLDEITARSWERFAKDAGLNAGFVKRRVRDLATEVLGQINGARHVVVDQGGVGEFASRTARLVADRAAQTLGTVSLSPQ